MNRPVPIVRLGAGEVALFGYGSLMLRESMERSLGRSYHGLFVDCTIEGWRRTWDIAMPNRTILADHQGEQFAPARIIYLNVRRAERQRVNGVLFVVSEEELAAFDRREWIYGRVLVTASLGGVEVQHGEAYVYAGLAQHEWHGGGTPRDVAVRASYLGIIEAALRSRPPAFREEYEASTEPPPLELVVREVESTLPFTTPIAVPLPNGGP
jgi:cation transport regulator ChaC